MKQTRPRTGIVRTIMAFGIGATAGSIVALLFAPAPGRVTRKKLAMRLREAQRVAGGKLGKGITQARTWVLEHVSNGHGRRPLHPHHVYVGSD